MSNLDAARAALRVRQGAGARYDADAAPAEALGWARRGTAYLARLMAGLDDAGLRVGSCLPGQSRARVLAAIALQGRAMAQGLEDAAGLPGDRAPTDLAALDLAETLPPRALRHLVDHAAIHLNVVWRDLKDDDWNLPLDLDGGRVIACDTARLRALSLWRAALDLNAGGRRRDLPAALAAEIIPTYQH